MKVSLIVVCHRSSGVLAPLVDSFRREAGSTGGDSEVVLVEQSEDAGEERAVAEVGADLTVVRPNRGYAAGINAGIEAARGDVLMLANPDLWFAEGSLQGLLAALGAGFDVVGPQLVWDRAGTVLFPLAEDPSPASELARLLRQRWQLPWRLGFGAWLDRMWAVWRATGPVPVGCLRGPLLVVGRETAERFGPLDEGYFLYYEETEWLLRARRRGARFAVVGSAWVEHQWGHSTDQLDDRAEVERASRDRFFARNYPPIWRWILRQAALGEQRAGVRGIEVSGPDAIPETPADLWVFSTFPHLQPSVGALDRSRPPARISEVASRGRWFAQAVGRSGGRWVPRGGWTWGRE